MSLNKDNPVIKSFINTAKQDLKNTVDNIESRLLQVCQSCTSAKECYEKLPAQADQLPSDLQTLLGTLKSLVAATLDQSTCDFTTLMSVAEAIEIHYKDTFNTLQSYPDSIGQAIYVASDDEYNQIYPDRLKPFMDQCFSSVNADSLIFFDWLQNQPIPTTVS